MRRIYSRLVDLPAGRQGRRAFLILKERAKVAIAEVDSHDYIVGIVGFATFFFGFLAGALVNFALLAMNHPLVMQFRASLSYTSSIVGDGILLPIINMVAVSFLLRNREYIGRTTIQASLIAGIAVTLWFHVNQAVQGVINWTMPAPWQWNILGIWHAIYMFCVASLISLFYLVSVKIVKEERDVPMQVLIVTAGIALFFVLLRIDYIDFNIRNLFPIH